MAATTGLVSAAIGPSFCEGTGSQKDPGLASDRGGYAMPDRVMIP